MIIESELILKLRSRVNAALAVMLLSLPDSQIQTTSSGLNTYLFQIKEGGVSYGKDFSSKGGVIKTGPVKTTAANSTAGS